MLLILKNNVPTSTIRNDPIQLALCGIVSCRLRLVFAWRANKKEMNEIVCLLISGTGDPTMFFLGFSKFSKFIFFVEHFF